MYQRRTETEQKAIAEDAFELITKGSYTLRKCAVHLQVSKSSIHNYVHKYIRGFRHMLLKEQLKRNQEEGRRKAGKNSKKYKHIHREESLI